MYEGPLVRPVIVTECAKPPVVVNTPAIAEYGVPLVVEYLHVAASLVVTASRVCVVPRGKVTEGEVRETTGGVVSLKTVTVTTADNFVFPAASRAKAATVWVLLLRIVVFCGAL